MRRGLATRAALGGIALYQLWISPRKGFRCAHAVLHGGPGCSGFAKQAIREQGLWHAVSAIRGRFRDCRAAMHTLLAQQSDNDEAENAAKGNDRNRRNSIREKWSCDSKLFACEGASACCSGTGSKGGAAAGAGGAAGAEAATGICSGGLGAVGEGIAGGCGAAAGGFSCCG
ncbi:MAG: membrane protein insertion efficiency factor YidD [Pseudomonadota bacterium]